MSSNEPSDQLAEYCTNLIEGYAWADTGDEAAEHIERELGWRPPPRVLKTPDDLQAMPLGSIVLADGVVCRRQRNAKGALWRVLGEHLLWTCSQLARKSESITVLWEPEKPAGGPHRIDVTHVAPGELERMARSGARPSPELRAAFDRARDRKEADRG